jgi:hypothetical protein
MFLHKLSCALPANAEGAIGAGAYPALAHDKKLASALYPVYVVVITPTQSPRRW